jgi:hypothetical protein
MTDKGMDYHSETAAEGLEEEEQEEIISKILSSKILLTLRTM